MTEIMEMEVFYLRGSHGPEESVADRFWAQWIDEAVWSGSSGDRTT